MEDNTSLAADCDFFAESFDRRPSAHDRGTAALLRKAAEALRRPPTATPDALVDPAAWLRARGWTEHHRARGGESYWRRTPNEPGWEGGWNLGGAVHMEIEADNRALLQRMGLYKAPTRTRRRR